MVCSSLPSGDNGGCTSELWEVASSSVTNSVMARMYAAVSSAVMASMASIAGYVVWSRNLAPNNLALVMIYLGSLAQCEVRQSPGLSRTDRICRTDAHSRTDAHFRTDAHRTDAHSRTDIIRRVCHQVCPGSVHRLSEPTRRDRVFYYSRHVSLKFSDPRPEF